MKIFGKDNDRKRRFRPFPSFKTEIGTTHPSITTSVNCTDSVLKDYVGVAFGLNETVTIRKRICLHKCNSLVCMRNAYTGRCGRSFLWTALQRVGVRVASPLLAGMFSWAEIFIWGVIFVGFRRAKMDNRYRGGLCEGCCVWRR